MAYSSSMKRAQAIKVCELCEKDSIKWRCLDCEKCLCENCKNTHLRIPVTSKHQIITIGTSLQDLQKKIAIDNMPCQDHPKKMTCLFCKSCDSLICPDCVSSSHKKHDFVPIESALDEKLDYLKGIKNRIDANLKNCGAKTFEVQKSKPKYNAIFDESLTKIKQKEQELINAIRKYSQELLEKVENERSKVNSILSKVNQDVDNTKKIVEDQRETIDAILTSNQGSLIFKTTMENSKDLKFDSIPNQVEQFIPKTESAKKIQELFGSMQELSIPVTHVLAEMDFKVIRTFTTDLPYIDQVVTIDKTSAWINCINNEVIRKVNIQDNNMTTSQEVSLEVYDIAVTSNNELLLSMAEGSDVKLLKRSGEITRFLTVAPLLPCGIHVTKDNDVIVGVREPGNTYTPTDQSQRALIVFGMDGRQKQRYHFNKSGKRLFTYPIRITTNRNQDIIVIDRTLFFTRRVVVLNKEGDLRWLYERTSKINASKEFDPRGVVTTSVGHVVVSDLSSNALHVLSENGEVLTCKVMTDMGIIGHIGLDIDCEGKLWLGCGTGGKEKGAKLHIIELIS